MQINPHQPVFPLRG
uniref:Uncharacterized protein n=1 Tax=Anguilla anguilla TaxID=7936 RepID=A0A0E9T0T3_ANGAN